MDKYRRKCQKNKYHKTASPKYNLSVFGLCARERNRSSACPLLAIYGAARVTPTPTNG